MPSPVYSTPEWYTAAEDQDVSSDIGRLTIFHHGFKQADEGTLVFAPVDFSSGSRAVLDIGTADGLWMRDLQSSVPPPPTGSHTFLGTDINASYFPTTSLIHITYLRRDVNDPLPPAWHNAFDLVNLRMILIAAASGPAQCAVVSEHIRALRPGGWIQIGDCERVCPTPVAENPRYHEMWACVRAVCEASGVDPLEPPKFKTWLDEAGLEEVGERRSMRAVGAQNADEEMGRLGVQADLMIARAFVEGAKALDPSIKPLPDERLDSLVQDLEVELTETGAYFPMRYVWGRKPL
ncbi:hypothetical protein E8E11_005335 [Didymella keratinophila]|nr:hypothetical protein E8E11_005335 [Didymella keratinophila]